MISHDSFDFHAFTAASSPFNGFGSNPFNGHGVGVDPKPGHGGGVLDPKMVEHHSEHTDIGHDAHMHADFGIAV